MSAFIGVIALQADAEPSRLAASEPHRRFSQLEGDLWPTPDDYRSASGAPGPKYWQQKVDYEIEVTLDEPSKSLQGRAEITYHNRSPDTLPFLWLLLDQNAFQRNAAAELTRVVSPDEPIQISEVRRLKELQSWQGGFSHLRVTDTAGVDLPFKVIETMMRVDLPQPLMPGAQMRIRIEWWLALPRTEVIGDRSGYECFTGPRERGDCIFEAAQWFPRLAPYSDYEGWHNQPFLITGEFGLEFGDYDVAITLPRSHVVAATGELQNPEEVLSHLQRQRLATAARASEPTYVVTPEEASQWRRSMKEGRKTWRFRAINVRDFAFASSPTFIWDAMGVPQDDAANPLVMAMAFYPNQARPLWSAYATKTIAHALRVYAQFAFPYPYATAQAVNGPVQGTEYPMITFMGFRPTTDRKTAAITYSEQTKYLMIGILIHEIGHNWFPMIVNSDERRWAWMDEGVTSFIAFQAEKLWDPEFPSRRGDPEKVVKYMTGDSQSPIMSEPDIGVGLGGSAYEKPAVALVVLRETVLGREVFDRAFRDYANRWRFKRPTPYDFFRTMEESSGHDLDWFWRGWFYSSDHVDVAIEKIVQGRLHMRDPNAKAAARRAKDEEKRSITVERAAADAGQPRPRVQADPTLRDFYNEFDRYAPTGEEKKEYASFLDELTEDEQRALEIKDHFYRFTFRNIGGLVTPLILRLDFADGSSETIRIPAHVWRQSADVVTWQYVTSKTLASAQLDPHRETADADRLNNEYSRTIESVLLDVSSEKAEAKKDLMRLHDRRVTPESLQTVPIGRE